MIAGSIGTPTQTILPPPPTTVAVVLPPAKPATPKAKPLQIAPAPRTQQQQPPTTIDLFGGVTKPKKRPSTATRIFDVQKKVQLLEKQVAANPDPFLIKSLEDHRALLQSLKNLPIYIEA